MAWQGNSMGVAWKQHAICELALSGVFTLGFHFNTLNAFLFYPHMPCTTQPP
jgi:hypothetical protein